MNSPSGPGSNAADTAKARGQQLRQSKWFGILLVVGLISYGVVHLLIAVIALQIAFTGAGGEASQQGAMARLAARPLGGVLLVIVAVGLATLVIWQAFVALWGHAEDQGATRLRKRLAAAGKAVVYAALAVSAISTAIDGAKSGRQKDKTLTARLMAAPFGRILVILVGVAVIAVGASMVYRGLAKKFTEDLEHPTPPTIRLGQIGFTAKGLSFAIVGVLFVLAGITYDPAEAGGLDAALRALREQSFGAVLLAVVAVGIGCFACYCFAWSRQAKP